MKKYKINKMLLIFFPFLFIVGLLLIYLGFQNKKTVQVNYVENNNITYNVYLKENTFFDTPYLTEGKTYIASLIDYIDIHYHYDIKYDMIFSGKTTYKLVAVVSANKVDSEGYYWQKEYDLSDEEEVKTTNNDRLIIDDTVKVKYSTYNDILDKFKREYNINTSGEIKVYMRINGSYKFSNLNKTVNNNSELNISVPLLQQALDVSINKDVKNDRDTVSFVETFKNPKYFILKILGLLIALYSVLGFLKATRIVRKIKDHNQYALELENILSKYDSIIANVKKLPSLTGFKIIEISTFEELLDVYNEVRMPINCYRTKSESKFVIINDETAWIFKLKNLSMPESEKSYEKEDDK